MMFFKNWLDELDDNSNLENGKPSNSFFTYHVTAITILNILNILNPTPLSIRNLGMESLSL